MKEQIYQDVKSALQQLADALGVASEHLWAILVKQQLVEAIAHSLFIPATIITGYFFFIAIKKVNQDDNYIPVVVLSGILFIACLFVFIATLSQVFMGFLNPEYGAFQEIKEILK